MMRKREEEMRDTNGNNLKRMFTVVSIAFLFFTRINQQQSVVLLSVFNVLSFGLSYLASFVSQEILQSKEAHRVTSTLSLCVKKTKKFC